MTDELTHIENESIHSFVQSAAADGYLSGRVLDYGCGKQPYRGIVEAAGGTYHGWDQAYFPANVSGEDVGDELWVGRVDWDAILCTQVIQYVLAIDGFFYWAHEALRLGNKRVLVMTYPTNWPEVNEGEDLWRFTRWGMERLLAEAGFTIIRHEPRHSFVQYGYEWVCGYGVVAQA